MGFKIFKFKRRNQSGSRPKPLSPLSVPTHFLCPISLDLMQDPVTVPSGVTYDRRAIETWISSGHHTCPVTQLAIEDGDDSLIPNHSIRHMIQEWCVSHRTLGVERIPTPKTPITSFQVAESLAEISAACHLGNCVLCVQLVSVLMKTVGESEKNRRCILSNGGAPILAAAFSKFKTEDFLSPLVGMCDKETLLLLASNESVRSIVRIMSKGSVSGKLSAISVLKDFLAAVHETEQAEAFSKTEGLVEQIVLQIQKPISLKAAKASLVAAYYLSFTHASKLAKLGLIPALLDMLVDAENSLCEKAMAVLDGVLDAEAGRESASAHALAVPLLVNKMFKVSDLATELAVSVIWKLCKRREDGEEGRREKCAVEALKVGVFQKLLLLLQVGCSRCTKADASDLLRTLNRWGMEEECVETLDFKGVIKRRL